MELCHESGWPHFVIWGVFRSWSFYERQSHKLARSISWLGLYEKKYSRLVGDEVLLKYFEPFLRHLTANIGMSCKLMAIYRIYGCFLLSMLLGMPASPTSASNWLTRFIWKEIFSSSRRRSIVKKLRAVFDKFYFKHRHVMWAVCHKSPYTAVYFYRCL